MRIHVLDEKNVSVMLGQEDLAIEESVVFKETENGFRASCRFGIKRVHVLKLFGQDV